MEVLVYIALFSILMGGLMTAINAIRVTAGLNDTQASMLEEGTFILEILAHAVEVGTLHEYEVSDGILVRNASSRSEPVSSNQMQVTGFTRTRITSEDSDVPYWIIRFTLTSHSPSGTPYTQAFSEEVPIFPS